MAKREYKKGELAILWDSELCTHCEACWRGLPQVFNPDARPWVNVNGATAAEIANQVRQCPSGALRIAEPVPGEG